MAQTTRSDQYSKSKSRMKQRARLMEAGICPSCGVRPKDGEFVNCAICREKNKAWREANKERRVNERNRIYQERRLAVLRGYGGKCACCGENESRFLTVDHVGDDGAEERKSSSYHATTFYKKLIDAGFPDNYQLLCFNCNCGRHLNGGVCPHESEGSEIR